MPHLEHLKKQIDHMSYKGNEVAERPTDMGKTTPQQDNDAAKTTKKTSLLANPDIKRWHDNLAHGSKLTAECRLRKLGRFCEMHEMTPMELSSLAMRDLRTATDLLEDHVTMLESQGYSPGTIDDHLKTVKSWLRHFDVEIKRKIKVSSNNLTPTLQNERVPNGSEINEIYSRANMRESVIISLMAKSGLRPEVLGNSDGIDGLRMRDMPDLVIHQGVVRCIRIVIVKKNGTCPLPLVMRFFTPILHLICPDSGGSGHDKRPMMHVMVFLCTMRQPGSLD